jgi:hypothetical protein
VLANVREFPSVGKITSSSDREIQVPRISRSIEGQSSMEEGNFIGTYLIIFGGVFIMHASNSSFDNISRTACNSKPS